MKVTHDKFLNGQLVISQPCKGYRAGVDPVLLAASCTAKDGDSILELGIGSGVASLCLARRVPNLELYGVEIQPAYAGLSLRNAARAGVALRVAIAGVEDNPSDFGDKQFHHVLMNPPYFAKKSGGRADDAGRAVGRAEQAPLGAWLNYGSKRLKPKGTLTMVQRMERLPDVLAHTPASLGSIRVQPLAARQQRAPNLFLLQAVKNGRAPFEMLPVIAMHEGDAHIEDTESYTDEIRDVLRNGKPLPCFR